MKQAHIYLATDSGAVMYMPRKAMYLITADGTDTRRSGVAGTTATRNGALLEALAEALDCLKPGASVTIHAERNWVGNMTVRCLPGWAKRNFKCADGTDIKYRALWERVWAKVKDMTVTVEDRQHEFTDWMLREMEKR